MKEEKERKKKDFFPELLEMRSIVHMEEKDKKKKELFPRKVETKESLED